MELLKIFRIYIETAFHITNVKTSDEEHFKFYVENKFFNELGFVDFNRVRGIVLGYLPYQMNEKGRVFSKKLFISNGHYNKTENPLINNLLSTSISNLFLQDKNVLFLRTPFLMSHDKNKTSQLINAFQPVFDCIIEEISRCTSSQIPVITFGFNAFNMITKSTTNKDIVNKPKFVIVQTNHSNWITENENTVTKSTSITRKRKLECRRIKVFHHIKTQIKLFEMLMDVCEENNR